MVAVHVRHAMTLMILLIDKKKDERGACAACRDIDDLID